MPSATSRRATRVHRVAPALLAVALVALPAVRAGAQDAFKDAGSGATPTDAATGAAPAGAPARADDSGPAGKTEFRVVEGYKVDPYTMMGFRTWRAAACDRCHGANQEGLVGPSLIESLKTLSKDDFFKTVREGRQDRGMVSFANSKMVMENLDALYTYLKGRSSGQITRARVEEIKP
jgi:mono/diheme cytochrome c family protein